MVVRITPGASAQFTAQPVDSNGASDTLPAGVIPTWTISDSTLATGSTDSTGLIETVVIAATATIGATFTLGIMATLPDGTTPSGSLVVPVVAQEVASFVITQTA